MNQSDIIQQLTQTFTPTHLDVVDDSHKHHGHRGTPHTENTHFKVTIVSEKFDGLTLIQRHRCVNDALAEGFKQQLHALTITAKTPDEWHV